MHACEALHNGLLADARKGAVMRIEHIAMYVNDLERAKKFFSRYFGAVPGNDYHNKKTDFRSCFLSFSDGAWLEIMNKPNMDDMKAVLWI